MEDAEFEVRKWPPDQPQSKAHGHAQWLGFAAFLCAIALMVGPFGHWTIWIAIPVAGLFVWSCVLLATKGRLRCPQCSRRFRGLDADTDDQNRVTYRCPKCKVIWVTAWIREPSIC
jgi:DNA-directed RNA polymerase subunit RPC12/RpoP